MFANFLLFFPFPSFYRLPIFFSSSGDKSFDQNAGVQCHIHIIQTHKHLYLAVRAGLEGDEDLIASVQLLDDLQSLPPVGEHCGQAPLLYLHGYVFICLFLYLSRLGILELA